MLEAGVEGAVIGGATAALAEVAAPLAGKVGGVLGKGLRAVAGDWYNTSMLKGAGIFKKGVLGIDHILLGDANGGYHYEGMPYAKDTIVPGTKSAPNAMGVYTADVNIGGRTKSSTFFPLSMSPQAIVDAINEAAATAVYQTGTRNTYIGVAKSGMRIVMYLNWGKVVSAYPEY